MDSGNGLGGMPNSGGGFPPIPGGDNYFGGGNNYPGGDNNPGGGANIGLNNNPGQGNNTGDNPNRGRNIFLETVLPSYDPSRNPPSNYRELADFLEYRALCKEREYRASMNFNLSTLGISNNYPRYSEARELLYRFICSRPGTREFIELGIDNGQCK